MNSASYKRRLVREVRKLLWARGSPYYHGMKVVDVIFKLRKEPAGRIYVRTVYGGLIPADDPTGFTNGYGRDGIGCEIAASREVR